MDPAAEELTSMELWAASKIIGRECATANKNYIICKRENGNQPELCESEAIIVEKCATSIVSELHEKFPGEFKSFQSCLDDHHYRFPDCRKTERDLLDCWNSRNEKR